MISLPLALTGFQAGVVFALAGMVFAAVMAGLGMFFHNRQRAMWHETARLALEKGQPLPAMPSNVPQPADPRAETSNDLRGGLVLIGVGLGLWEFLGMFIGPGIGAVGAIPGFIGVALLISGAVRLLVMRKESSKTARPPQP